MWQEVLLFIKSAWNEILDKVDDIIKGTFFLFELAIKNRSTKNYLIGSWDRTARLYRINLTLHSPRERLFCPMCLHELEIVKTHTVLHHICVWVFILQQLFQPSLMDRNISGDRMFGRFCSDYTENNSKRNLTARHLTRFGGANLEIESRVRFKVMD